MTTSNEPIRLRALALGAAGAVLVAVVAWSAGADPRAAVGVGAGALVEALGLAEWARRHTWGPRTHAAAVAYALTLDPDQWADELPRLGVADRAEAARLVGLDPPDDQ